jgi:hypothetical protein
VERSLAKANRFDRFLRDYIESLMKAGKINLAYGSITNDRKYPYDYSSIAERYASISFNNYLFTFSYDHRFDGLDYADKLKEFEDKTESIYVGKGPDKTDLFFGKSNRIAYVQEGQIVKKEFFIDILKENFDKEVPVPKVPYEYTDLLVLDQTFPIGFLLGYKYGIT